ncbi:probable CCR4-associated factor 1 homolog 6 [Prosopis cineraria]|uniref:probable CCR4-associated factor 1 homolog 6 n=1 Tax=Prosopis cineraria TaxID=364024 RepID=UPI00240F34CF|nr:probable CCR4-associated factor 1 homolog 6 [Prosopis cineraria]
MSIPNTSNVEIREVWANNLHQEIELIQKVVENYQYVAMDTEFPGTVHGRYMDTSYETLKKNVNDLKLIQLGLTFSDDQGNLPTLGNGKYCVWQFNFREFDPAKDKQNQQSITLLVESGIDFKRNREEGVEASEFSKLLTPSDAVLNCGKRWIVFHGSSDFGYLVKVLTGRPLPDTESDFMKLVKVYFPKFYDVEYMMKSCGIVPGGLRMLAEILDVNRIGSIHQAGSDSLLTCHTFFKLIEVYDLKNKLQEKFEGVLSGLGPGANTCIPPEGKK